MERVEPGYYRHWKHGHVYVVDRVVEHHETGQKQVIYHLAAGSGQYNWYSRPASEWYDKVGDDPAKQVTRFERVDPPQGKNYSNTKNRAVFQDWVLSLPYMQQSCLIQSSRGPDSLPKEHPAKGINRWLRRCFLLSAFDGKALLRPDYPGGGSFTGPSIPTDLTIGLPDDDRTRWQALVEVAERYFDTVDELPHHYQMHVVHAAQILGFKHPDDFCRKWWAEFYRVYVNKLHLEPEPLEKLEDRLSDRPATWKGAEKKMADIP